MTARHVSPPHVVAHRAVAAAATTVVHEDPHASDSHPDALELTPAQKTLIGTLRFLSAYQLNHLHKVSPDVAAAFDSHALSAIESAPPLGGGARADQIRALIDRHTQLAEIAAIVGPLARLVGQNLLATDAELARHAGEPLKVAHSLHASQPELLEHLAALDRWTREHYHGAHPTPAAAPTPGATNTK